MTECIGHCSKAIKWTKEISWGNLLFSNHHYHDQKTGLLNASEIYGSFLILLLLLIALCENRYKPFKDVYQWAAKQKLRYSQ